MALKSDLWDVVVVDANRNTVTEILHTDVETKAAAIRLMLQDTGHDIRLTFGAVVEAGKLEIGDEY